MKLAILSDIHANYEALTACLAHAERQGAQRYAFLGDHLGYGADPHACLDLIRQHAASGAIVLRGNHDEAALGGLCANMHPEAREAIVWTRPQLNDEERSFIAGLPYLMADETQGGRLFVHASADQPGHWTYLLSSPAVEKCLAATDARLIFVGHVHTPILYYSTGAGLSSFVPQPGAVVPLSAGRRWVLLVGSVGQPRDGNPAAAYAILDEEKRELHHHRVAYDWITAAHKIRAAGLPENLAARLAHGQ